MASSPRLVGSGSIPEPGMLSMRATQTDSYVEIKGGDLALIDPLQSGITTALSIGATVPNLIADKPAATVSGAFTSVSAAKGFSLTASTADEKLDLPAAFNLSNLGTTPSAVISAWITLTGSALPAGQPSIMGCAYQIGVNTQWAICTYDVSDSLRLFVRSSTPQLNIPRPSFNVPHLVTLALLKNGATYDARAYVDGVLAASLTGLAYPFVNPGAVFASAQNAQIGTLPGGFLGTAAAVVHRCRVTKVDPAVFNITDYNAQELTANAGARFG